MFDMKAKLVEILGNTFIKREGVAVVESTADYLLANGVILPPCKVGDRYVMDTAKTIFNAWNDVTGALVEGTSWYYELESVIEDIVKLSFGAGVLYKEEAEEKLKELG